MQNTEDKPKRNRRLAAALLCGVLAVVLAAGALYAWRLSVQLGLRQELLQEAASRTISVAGQSLLPCGGSLTVTDRLGRHTETPRGEAGAVTLTSFADAAVSLPEAIGAAAVVTDEAGTVLFSGDAAALAEEFLPKNGRYLLELTISVEGERAGSWGTSAALSGSLCYRAALQYEVTPQFTLSSSTLMQGDAIVLRAAGIYEGAELSADTGGVMDYMNFAKVAPGVWQAILGVSYRCTPGQYACTVTLDGESRTLPFTVTEQSFSEQHLTINSATKSATVDNSAAQTQYNNMIAETMYHWVPEIYFDGPFLRPVEGRVTTEFGLYRYTNGSSTPSRHVGVDIAAAKGTPVAAAAPGVVLVAERLTTTGWTVCVEHGMGVHSYYYHMDSIAVEKGADGCRRRQAGRGRGNRLRQRAAPAFQPHGWGKQRGSLGRHGRQQRHLCAACALSAALCRPHKTKPRFARRMGKLPKTDGRERGRCVFFGLPL